MPSETIYVPLLDEGTAVWKPVAAERLSDGTFRILSDMPEDENWAYKPGQRVVVAQRMFSGGMRGLVAGRLAIDETPPLHDWAAVEQSIAEAIALSPDSFNPSTLSNVGDLLGLIRTHCPIPKGVAKGYWSTIRLWWENVEVEICDDHYELYRFFDKQTKIEHFDRPFGSDVPADMLNQLPAISEPSL